MQHSSLQIRTLLPSLGRLSALGLVLSLGVAASVAACAPPTEPKEAEDVAPPGAMEGVEAEAISTRDEASQDESEAEEKTGGEATEFHDLSPQAKMDFMKTTVLPQMKAVFQAHDAEEFAKFSCGTCHGSGARSGNFHMPSEELPALDEAEMAEHPEMSKFMAEQVVPKMAELLGEELEGEHRFGCFDCHTKKD